MKKLLLTFMGIVLLFCLIGCGSTNIDNIVKLGGSDQFTLLIGNNLGETLGTLDLNGYQVQNNILTLGQSPNQIVVRNGLAYVVNSLSNSIQVINLLTSQTIREISLGTGKNPMNIAVLSDQKAYVTNFIANTVTVIDPSEDDTSKQILKTIALPSGADLPANQGVTTNAARPQGAVIKDDKLYVNLANLNTLTYMSGGPSYVCVIDTQDDAVIKKIETTGKNANGIYTDDNLPHKIYVSCTGTWIGDGTIEVIDTATDTLSKSYLTGGAPGSLLVYNDKVYLGDLSTGQVSIFSKDTSEASPSISNIELVKTDFSKGVFGMIGGLAVDNDGKLFVTEFSSDSVYVVDTGTEKIVTGPITVGDGPQAVAIY